MTKAFNRRTFLGATALTGVVATLPGCVTAGSRIAAGTETSPASNVLMDAVAEALLREYPEAATSLGLDNGARADLKHRLTDRSLAGVAARAQGARDRLKAVRAAIPALEGSAKLDAEVVAAAHEIAVDGYAFGYGDTVNLDPSVGYRNGPYVVAQNMGAFVEVPDFLDSKHTLETADDAVAYIDRVKDYAAALAGETERLTADRTKGIVAPDFLLDKTLKILRGGVAQPTPSNGLVTAIVAESAKAGLPDGYARTVAQMVDHSIRPALAAQVAELERHRAIATSDAGVWDLPQGEAYYRWALKAGTTTNLSPQEIHQLGHDNLRIIQDRMDGVLKANGMSGGTVGERMAALAKRPDQLFPNTPAGREQLLTYLRGLVDDIRGRMPQAFNTLVPGFLEVKRVPPEIEAGAPGGYAGPGSIDGKQPGSYYINLRDTANHPKYGLPTLTYHEAIPGHVWQGEYTFKQPLVRSLLAFNAYSEGWALYAEQLADELGVYGDNPLGVLGYLQANAFRCCRLVVDTGMHALRWDRERAIRWFMENNGSGYDEVQGEIDRYCAWPGQACGYKVGQIAINRARDRAQAQLGARYDLRDFNDAVVLGGAVPMTVLDGVIDRYIAAKQG